MGFLDNTRQAVFKSLRDANPSIPAAEFERIIGEINEQIAKEPPPRVAVIGETGVGKSTTLNALFNAGQEISHVRACTQEEAEIQVPVSDLATEAGSIIVYDMPGLGESIATRSRHLETYDRVLRKVDVALWILDANDRAIENVQTLLSTELRRIDASLVDRMVFALNKVDLVHPGATAWYPPANLPGEEQERNIVARLNDVEAKILEAVPTWRGSILGYSAEKRFGLPQLFRLMMEAVSQKRQWVLASRKSLADFFELVDPGLLPEDVRAARSKAGKAHETKFSSDAAVALRSLSPQEFANVSTDKEALAAWLEEFGTRRQNGES